MENVECISCPRIEHCEHCGFVGEWRHRWVVAVAGREGRAAFGANGWAEQLAQIDLPACGGVDSAKVNRKLSVDEDP